MSQENPANATSSSGDPPPASSPTAATATIDSQLQRCISGILNASWSPECPASGIDVSGAAFDFGDRPAGGTPPLLCHYTGLADAVLGELAMLSNEIVLRNLNMPRRAVGAMLASNLRSWIFPSMPAEMERRPAGRPPKITCQAMRAAKGKIRLLHSQQEAHLKHLIASHARCTAEEHRYASDPQQLDAHFASLVQSLLAHIRRQLIASSLEVLRVNSLVPMTCICFRGCCRLNDQRPPLLEVMYTLASSVSRQYLSELLAAMQTKDDNNVGMDAMWDQFLDYLLRDMIERVSDPLLCVRSITVLHRLTQIEIPAPPSSASTSVASMLTSVPQTIRPISDRIGRKRLHTIDAAIAFLQPFMSVSVYYDENPDMALGQTARSPHWFSLSSAVSIGHRLDVQRQLNEMRYLLYWSFDQLMADAERREQVMRYFAEVLRRNAEAGPIERDADKPLVRRRGGLLNLMSVLQRMAVGVQLEQVDAMYPYRKGALVERGWSEQTDKMVFGAAEYWEWLDKLRTETNKPSTVNGPPTELWFLTLYAHHLAIIPAIRDYRENSKQHKRISRTTRVGDNRPLTFDAETALYLKYMRCTGHIALNDANVLAQTTKFYSKVCEFVLYQLEDRPMAGPFVPLVRPHLMRPAEAFKAMPRWCLTDIVDFLLFAIHNNPEVMREVLNPTIVLWLLTCICVVRKQRVSAKLIKLLYAIREDNLARVWHSIYTHELTRCELIAALMRHYIEVKINGDEIDVGASLKTCFQLTHLLRNVWKVPVLRQHMIDESRSGNDDLLHRFIDRLMDNTEFLLLKLRDHLDALNETRRLFQQQTAQPLNEMSQTEAISLLMRFRRNESDMLPWLELARESLDAVKSMVDGFSQPFLRAQTLQQLTQMLNRTIRRFCCCPRCLTSASMGVPAGWMEFKQWFESQVVHIFGDLRSTALVAALAEQWLEFGHVFVDEQNAEFRVSWQTMEPNVCAGITAVVKEVTELRGEM